MTKRIVKIGSGVLALCACLILVSCTDSIERRDEISNGGGGNRYGSLSVSTGDSSARSIDVSEITSADVSVIGSLISSAEAATLKKENVKITNGRGSGVTIDKIPVGNNRVVVVEAKTTIDNVLQKIAGATMTAAVDIGAGSNSATVNWASSKVGNVYKELIDLGYNVGSLERARVESYLPKENGSTIHAALIDAAQLAQDIKSNTVRDSSAYALETGTITFHSDVTSDNVSIQVCDPSSAPITSVKAGTNTITGVAPGAWKVFGIVDGTTVVYSSSVTVEPGEEADISEEVVHFQTPKPRLENASGTAISEFITSDTTVYLKSRTYDGEEEPSGVVIYYTTDGTTPTTASTKYTSSGISVSKGTKLSAIAVCSGLLNSDVSSWTFAEPTLGFKHPANGDYSTVDETSWATATYALGAHVSGGNTTFALYSANATKVLLEIYESAYGTDEKYDYWMTKNTSDNVWRAKLSGDLSGAIYAFRVWGPNWDYDTSWTRGGSSAGFVADYDSKGNRFNPNKVVFDPYAREMTHDKSNPTALGKENAGMFGTGEETYTMAGGTAFVRREFDTGKWAPKGYIITDSTSYGTKPQIAQKDAIIYEAHVRGITKHSSATQLSTLLSGYSEFSNVVDIPEEYRGTYKGAALLVPYLKALGVNTIELLPVHETDNDANPEDGPGGNFWGYMTFDYFAPDRRYSSDKSAGGPTKEFKEMVKTFHDAGMEVYLDVVYNHSGEGGTWYGEKDSYKTSEIFSMRGIDNSTYYSLVSTNKGAYWETTGCGNNLQCDNTVVRQFILDSLTYWIDEMGVDGFRFDLATVLGRVNDGSGNWNYSNTATTLTKIAALGASKNVEMVAESWDTGSGSYQVGNFPDGWAGWNGYYRDTARAYVGNGQSSANITYTDALYGDSAHFSVNDPSVNFIVAHDGFTLADLCSFSGEGNYYNSRLSWPFGPSDGGNSDNNAIGTGTEAADRRQRARNYMAFQMFGAGIPMIVYGDELGRTQNGNNNPYNIDSVATWNNYNMIPTASPQAASTGSASAAECGTYNNMFGTYANTANKNGQFVFSRFVMNERLNNSVLREITGKNFTWYSTGGASGWADEGAAKAIMISGDQTYYVMMNLNSGETSFTIPAPASGCNWVRIVDTGAWAESSFNCWDEADASAYVITESTTYGVGAYTITILKKVSEKETCATPTISSTSGTSFAGGTISVTITTTTSGATIYYTTDGTTPSSTNGTAYTGAISVSKTTTIKAMAVAADCKDSAVASETFTNTANCADPVLSVPAGDFWNTITVFVTSSDSGVSFYYTTDGSDPTTSSTAYASTKGIDISATTTLKVIASDGSKTSDVVSATYTLQSNPTYTEDASGVMLQGFNWDSANTTTQYWYNVINNNAASINNTFEYIWLPPPGNSPSDARQGYAPKELNDLNNYYGTADELASAISAVKPTKAIADIVVNHRAGYSDWGDFVNPKWCDDFLAICSDDEGFTNSATMTASSTSMRGATDTGTGYESYRDLDHTSVYVQKGIYSWMNSVLKRAGFVGWRYDYVHGFSGDYVGYYNAKSNAAFSVGELWSSQDRSNWPTLISNWVSATGNTLTDATGSSVIGQSSRAFDFVLKGYMNDVFGSKDEGVENNNFNLLASSSSLMRSNPSAAVTFVDNHDTGSTQKEWYLDPLDIAPAYAFILTHPGMPCVAWQHYFTYAESGSKGSDSGAQYIGGETVPGTAMTYRQLIDRLIAVRKSAGITVTSSIEDVDVTSEHYVVKVTGTNHALIVKIGGGSYTPNETGYDASLPVVAGTNFAVWEYDKSVFDYDTSLSKTTVYFYNSNNFSSVNAHVWTDGGQDYTSWPGAYMTADGSVGTAGNWYKLTIPNTADKVQFSNAGADSVNGTFASDTPYYKDGAWYASASDAESGTGGTTTLTVTNNHSWETVYAYAWYKDGDSNVKVLGEWPGTEMSFSYTNTDNQGVFIISASDLDKAIYVIFTNNSGSQTVDVTISESANHRWWIKDSKTENNYDVATW